MAMNSWRFGIIEFEPMLTVDPDGTMHGLSSHVIEHLALSFNVSIELVRSPDGGFGTKMKDGNWTGIMGSIQRGEADLFGVPLAANPQRMDIVDYSPPIHTSYFIIATALKTEMDDNYWGLFATFKMEVWLGVLFSIMFLVSLSSFIDVGLNSVHGVKATKKTKIASDHFWNYLASFFSEGTPKEPVWGINKWLMFVWCISVLTLMNAFTGHFKSQLTIIAEPKQIENVVDLAKESDDLKVLIWGGSSFEVFVRTAEAPAYKNLENKANKNGGFINVREYFTWENYEDTVLGKSAFMVETTTFSYFLGLMCSIAPDTKIHLAKEAIYPIHAYFPYTKRFSKETRDAIDKKLYQFVETGLKEKWRDDITDDSTRCTSGIDTSGSERTLGFSDLRAVFVLYLSLLGFSTIVLVAEIIFKPKKANYSAFQETNFKF